jgi:hypothetical protein
VGWKIVSGIFFLLFVLFLVWFAFDRSWPIYAAGFSLFIAVLTFLVSIFARRGSTIWKGRGKG